MVEAALQWWAADQLHKEDPTCPAFRMRLACPRVYHETATTGSFARLYGERQLIKPCCSPSSVGAAEVMRVPNPRTISLRRTGANTEQAQLNNDER